MEVQNELKPPEPGKTKGTGKKQRTGFVDPAATNNLFDSSVIILNFWCKTNFLPYLC